MQLKEAIAKFKEADEVLNTINSVSNRELLIAYTQLYNLKYSDYEYLIEAYRFSGLASEDFLRELLNSLKR